MEQVDFQVMPGLEFPAMEVGKGVKHLHRRCSKCGSSAVKVEYAKACSLGDWIYSERLLMTCECGFEWHTPCLDANE